MLCGCEKSATIRSPTLARIVWSLPGLLLSVPNRRLASPVRGDILENDAVILCSTIFSGKLVVFTANELFPL